MGQNGETIKVLGVTFLNNELVANQDLDALRNGFYYTSISSVVNTLTKRPQPSSSGGELLILSMVVGNTAFQIAYQNDGANDYIKKRAKRWNGNFSAWTDF